MTNNISSNPSFLLTRFERDEGVPAADGQEKFGNFACGLLQISFGREVTVSQIHSQDTFFSYEGGRQPSSIIRIIISIAIFILTLPVSLPLMIAGVISLSCSKSYNALFNDYLSKQKDAKETDKTNEIDPLKEKKFPTAQEALTHLAEIKCEHADLRKYKDLDNEHLNFLAATCPEIKSLRICSKNIDKIPDAFKNLEVLEIQMAGDVELPQDLGKLKSLKTSCTTIKHWPNTLKNIETLYLVECCTETLPQDLSKLTKFSFQNTGSILESELARLPPCCSPSWAGWPEDFELLY